MIFTEQHKIAYCKGHIASIKKDIEYYKIKVKETNENFYKDCLKVKKSDLRYWEKILKNLLQGEIL